MALSEICDISLIKHKINRINRSNDTSFNRLVERIVWKTRIIGLSHFHLCSYFVLFIIYLLIPQPVAAQGDLRCFLLQGGSVQNFFVSESLAVGSVIGTLNIGGDASEDGDIYLRLEQPNSPVQISPNSKDLILTEKLDKEGKNGRSHVVINVICQKRKMNDVDTRIPINIRVTDANDNSPVFFNAPYFVNISEATVVNAIILGDIRATDDDQKGPFSTIQYSIAPGPHSDKFSFESPISGALQLKQPLDYEVDSLFNLTIVAEDQGSPPLRTETFVTVQVTDSDDQNPSFTKRRYMAFLPDTPVQGTAFEIQPGPIKAEDQDKGIRARISYSLGNEVKEADYFTIEANTGEVFITKDVPEDTFMQPVTLSVMATQVDNPDRVATAILIISRRGATSTQLQFLQRSYEKTVNENLPKGTLIAQTLINKKPAKNIRFTLQQGGMGIFRISSTGDIILDHELDYERHRSHELDIYVTDSEYNDTATLKVNVLNVNDWDPRFQYPQYAFHVTKNLIEPGDIVGNVSIADGDNDDITLSIRGRDSRMFSINSLGEISIKRSVELNSTEAHINLVARDSGKPPRETSVPVIIYFPKSLVKSSPIEVSSSFLLMVVFGSLVAIFILIIICLAIYIHKKIHPRVGLNSSKQILSNIKKYRDDNEAALPTKMSQIISNGGPPSNKLDQLSPANHQQQDAASDITGVEAPRSNGSILETNNAFKRGYTNGSFRASTISVRSNAQSSLGGTTSNHGSRRYSRNPLVNGSSLMVEGGQGGFGVADGGDSLSLNGSNATTASTATAGSDSPQNRSSRASTPNAMSRFITGKSAVVNPSNGSMSSICTYDGTARATGGLPHNRIAPTPPVPPVVPGSLQERTCFEFPSTSGITPRKFSANPSTGSDGAKRIVWPTSTIPKKVKKLSWEDELNSQTELNPEVSVTPMPQTSPAANAPNLTVYF